MKNCYNCKHSIEKGVQLDYYYKCNLHGFVCGRTAVETTNYVCDDFHEKINKEDLLKQKCNFRSV